MNGYDLLKLEATSLWNLFGESWTKLPECCTHEATWWF